MSDEKRCGKCKRWVVRRIKYTGDCEFPRPPWVEDVQGYSVLTDVDLQAEICPCYEEEHHEE
jgi:hypothetical protein